MTIWIWRLIYILIAIGLMHWLFHGSGIVWTPTTAQVAWLLGMAMGYAMRGSRRKVHNG